MINYTRYGVILKNKDKGDPINTAGFIKETPGGYGEFIFEDPNIFTPEARAAFLKLPEEERAKFLSDLLEEFYRKNPEYATFSGVTIYTKPRELLEHFKSITAEDFERAKVSLSSAEYTDRYKELQRRIKEAEEWAKEYAEDLDGPDEYKPIDKILPILQLRYIFTESELAAFYYLKHPRKKANEIIKPEVLTAALDPVTTAIYQGLSPGKKDKLLLAIPTTAHKKDAPETHINALLYFDEDITAKYNSTKQLTAFDKLVASALYSIWRSNHNDAGQCITTLTAIHKCINKSKPNSVQLEKILNSLRKQTLIRISIDNKPEAERLDYDRYHTEEAAIFEVRFLQETTRNGKTTDAAILVLGEPPVFIFAEKHGHQLTDIPVEVFQSGIALTDKNLAIQDYLIRRVAPTKNKVRKLLEEQHKKYTLDRQKKITKAKELPIKVDTLLANVGRKDTDTKDKSRAVNTAMKYIDHFKKCGWIKSARLSKDKKTIYIELQNH